MALTSGIKLGPYEIVAPLGAGGMGEVYRARDPRLGRDVAIKVLPGSFAADTERLRRFEQEAHAVAALNYPNILAIYDVGEANGAPYVVSEILEGETLRDRLRSGPLSSRKVLDYGLQIARGLAAAHEKGIVHRDLKPENLFITTDNRVKILDFGLAKLTRPEEGLASEDAPTMQAVVTDAGLVMGTVGYMSPEQVRGKAADPRSDLFSFGTILYEMLSGKRAFRGDTPADTMSAILKEDPPELSETARNVPPGLERIVDHCIEKNPAERFQSAHDIAFDLQSLLGQTPSAARVTAIGKLRRRNWSQPVAVATAVVAALLVGYFARGRSTATPPKFRQLTFQRGSIKSAAFAPDGQTVIYSAMWNGKPMPEVFSTRIGDLLSRPLQLDDSEIVDISSSGEMAILEHWRSLGGWTGQAMLARMAISGGAPREVVDGVQSASWAPDASSLAVARHVGTTYRLEYPIGHVLYETPAWLDYVRVSPSGERVAFIEHPAFGDSRGSVMMIGRDKRVVVLSPDWSDVVGLAWSPSDDEVWFTASDSGISRALLAATTSGKVRTVLRVPGSLTIHGFARDGKVLLNGDTYRRGTLAHREGEKTDHDLAWFDWTRTQALSPDGQWVLFDEEGEGGGHDYTVYVRKTDGSPAIRLGPGRALALSPDGKWALAEDVKTRQYILYPTGAGEQRQLTHDNIVHGVGGWTPDGKWIVFDGFEPNNKTRIWIMPAEGGAAKPITPEGIVDSRVMPDGERTLARNAEGKYFLYPLHGDGSPSPVPQLNTDDGAIGWATDGHTLFVREAAQKAWTMRVVRVDLNTGKRELFKEIEPPDRSGILSLGPIQITPDGKIYVYGFTRRLSDLYVVEGLR
jgi:eukaryotic-like serine/threonine-protein kinase